MNIKRMTIQEKLEAMELLWDDLRKNVPDVFSPSWHENILKERDKNLLVGKDKFVDWEKAKKDIYDSIS